MNKIAIPLLLFLLSCNSNSNSPENLDSAFEGIISYKTEVSDLDGTFTNAQLNVLFGDSMTLYVKGNNYKMVFNGRDILSVVYLGDSNKQYAIRYGIDSIYVGDCSKERQPLLSSILGSESDTILGKLCRSISNTLGPYVHQYWFDSTLAIEDGRFQNHQFGHLNAYFAKSKSWYLKYQYQGIRYSLTHTAVGLNQVSLDCAEFSIPDWPRTEFK
ncbi:MAG: hypothetical protein EP332_09690 [Bacteroidetes bacterium]|nr:MAG: hypothetical protein EP332_09690 [Bacteroidota bacterium]